MSLRPGLPALPARMRGLPVDRRGFPVPFFVEWINGEPCFPVVSEEKRQRAHVKSLCWVCGQKLGAYRSYVLGPMCTVSRTTSEPACHLDCAEFSVKACPFMVMPKMKRNDALYPEGTKPAHGIAIERNPGVSAIWTQRGAASVIRVPQSSGGGWLLSVHDPDSVSWWREGRAATRAEVDEAYRTGLPILEEADGRDPAALAEIHRMLDVARAFMPAAA